MYMNIDRLRCFCNCFTYSLTRAFIIFVISLASFVPACAQLIKEVNKNKDGHTEIPFQYINGFIVVDVIFQKFLPLKFILDTGAENTILLKKEIAEVMRLPYQKRIKLIGSDMSQEVYALVSNATFLQVTNLPLSRQNIIVLEEDYLYLEEYIGSPVDGILGAEFFKDRVVKIDYRKEIITVIEPRSFKPSRYKKYHALDMEVISRKPYISATTEVNPGQAIQTRLLIDTGAGVSSILHNNVDTAMTHKGKFIKGSLGKGLGGNIEGYIGTIQSMKIGEFTFNNMISSFQSVEDAIISEDKRIRHGLLGNLLWERFDLILDFYQKKLYLKPTKNYNKSFKFDRSGLTIFSFGPSLRQYYVKYVAENSPAHQADIREGDEIIGIGRWSYKWFTLKKINKMLTQDKNKTIKFKIKRGKEILEKEFELRDLI
jgi:predicted aspartyl protease